MPVDTQKLIKGIGYIPSDWSVVKADDVCTKITKGTTPPKSEIVDDGVIPFLRVNNLTFNGGLGSSDNFLYVSEQSHRNFLARSIAYPNDILMNIVGPPLGKTARLTDSFPEYNMNQAIVIYRSKPSEIDLHFFHSYLKGTLAQRWLAKHSKKTSGQQNLTIELCKNLPTPLPPLPEQRKIAEILNCWNEAIETTERLIEAKVKLKQGLIRGLLFGSMRLPDYGSKTEELIETRYFGYPKEWKLVEILDIATEIKLKNSDDESLTVLSCTKHHGLVDSLKYFGKKIYSDDLSKYRVVSKYDFAYATNHIEEGSIGYSSEYEKALISPIYTVFRTNDRIDDFYLFKILKTELYRHIFEVNTSASVDRRGSLRWKDFSKIKVPLPPIEEQLAIAEVIKQSEIELELFGQLQSELSEQKKGLMQKLLTGKIRVKV